MAKRQGRRFTKGYQPARRTSARHPAAPGKVSYVNSPVQDPRDPPPSAPERQAEIERCLGLAPGVLAPELVVHRQRQHELRITASINESIDFDLMRGRRRVGH